MFAGVSEGGGGGFQICIISLCLSGSVKAVYNELHDALMAINEQEDLRWWKNTHGPGMPTDWPQFQVLISCFLNI